MQGPETSGKSPIEQMGARRSRASKLERIDKKKLNGQPSTDDNLDSASMTWKAMFHATKESVVIIDGHSRIIQANLATSHLLGKSLEHIIGQKYWQAVHGTRQPPQKCPLKKALSSGEHQEAELYLSEKGIWIEALTDPIIDSEGRINGAVHIIRNITARKKAEEALRKSEEQHRAIFEGAVDGIVYADRTARVIDVNSAFTEITGIPREDVVGRSGFHLARRFARPRDIPQLLKAVRLALSGNPVELYELEINNRIVEISTPSLRREKSGITGILRDITERKKTQKVLAESEEKYRSIFENIVDVYYRADLEGNLLLFSPSGLKLLGYDGVEELEGKNLVKDFYYHPKDREAFLRELTERGRVDNYEVILRRKDGTPVFGETNSYLVYDRTGKPVAVEGIFRDISDRKKAEEALRESEKRFRNIFENALIGMYRTTPHGQILMANPALVRMLGYASFEALAARNLEREGFEQDYPRSEFKRRIETDGRVIGLESAWRKMDGTTLFVRESAQAIRDKAGHIVYYQGTVEDITERKRTEQALRASENRLALAIECTGLGLWDEDFQTGEITRNENWMRMLGYEPQEIRSNREAFRELIHPDDVPGFEECAQAHEVGMTSEFDMELRVRTKSGQWRWIRDFGRIVKRDEEGKPLRAVGVHLDVTERKMAEEAYRLLVDRSLQGLVIFQEGHVVFVNEAMARISGYTVEEMLSMSPKQIREFVHPEDREVVWSRHKQRLEGKLPPERYEIRCIRKDDSIRWLEIDANRVEYQGGPAIQTAYLDITDRKNAEQHEKEYIRELQFLSESASEFVKLTPDKDIYSLIAKKIQQLNEGSIVSVQTFDEASDSVCVRAVEGLGKHTVTISKMLGANPVGQYFPLGDTAKETLGRGELVQIEGGIYGLSPGIPKVVYQAIEKLLNVGEVYAMGLLSDGRLHGSATILTRGKTSLKNRELIETFINQAAVAIHRWEDAAALRRSEAKWRSLTENSSDFIMLLGTDGAVLFINRTRHLSKQEVLGKPVYELLPPEYRATAKKCVEEVFHTGQSREFETEYRTQTGEVQIFEARLGPVQAGNKIVAVTVGARDITERKKSEAALKESERRYRELFENSRDGFVVVDAESHFMDANQAYCDMLGYTLNELREKEHFYEITPAQWRDWERREILEKRLLTDGYSGIYEKEYIRKDGTVFPVELQSYTVFDQERHPRYLWGIVRDISERKKAEEAYFSLVDKSLQGLVIMQDGRVVFANQTVVDITGYTVDEMVGASAEQIQAFVHPDDQALVWGRQQARLRGEPVPNRYEFRGIHKDGSLYWVECCISQIEYRGKPAIQSALMDITERKIAEQKIADDAAFQSVLATIRGGVEIQSERQTWKVFLENLIAEYGFRMAWFGAYADGRVRPSIWTGDAGTYLDGLVLDISEPTNPDAACAMSQCILSRQPFGYADLAHDEGFKAWRQSALDHGFGSNMALPFIVDGRVEGGLMVYASTAHGFSGERTHQLQNLVEDIAQRLGERRKREKARQALQESEERLRSIIDHSVELFFLHDTDHNLIFVSPQSEAIFGYAPEDMVVNWTGLTTDNPINEKGLKLTEQAIRTGIKQEPYLLEIKRKNGDIRIVEIDESPVKNEKGEVVAISGALRDVTERKRAEETIRRSEEFLDSVIEKTPNPMWLSDEKGTIIRMNQALRELLRVEEEEMIGKYNILKDRQLKAQGFLILVEKVFAEGRTVNFELQYDTGKVAQVKLENHVQKTLELTLSSLKDNDGRLTNVICQHKDITERKKAEAELRGYQAKLKAMASEILQTQERERQRLAIGLHDDICQKLVLTKLTLESSLRSLSDTALADSLKLAAETLGETIRQAESLTFELSDPVLREFGFVAALEKYLATEIRDKHGIDYALEADDPIGFLTDDTKTCLYRVARELLTNVVKHARAGKVKVTVRKSQSKIHVAVQDDGVGFDSAKVKGENGADVRFGLFSVREQLEYLGGLLVIESKPGRGTVAKIVI